MADPDLGPHVRGGSPRPRQEGPTKILYIEDNPENRLLVRSVLQSRGYVVIEASDGPSGLDLAVREAPQLVLLDINLPGMNGYEVAGVLRRLPTLSGAVIVAVTAYATADDRKRTLVAGCDGYIQKPIDVDAFPRQIAEFLSGKREPVEEREAGVYLRELNQQFVFRLACQVEEMSRVNRQLKSAKEEIEALAGIAREISQTLDLDQVLGLTLQQTIFLAGADLGYIALVQEDGTARSVAVPGQCTVALEGRLTRPGAGLAGRALATGEVQECADRLAEFLPEEDPTEGVRSVLVVPIKLRGAVLGLIWLARRSPGSFGAEAKARLLALSLPLAIALDNARLYREISQKKQEVELANASLAERLRVESEFLNNTTHELRTPLCSILGLLEGIANGLCVDRDEERSFIRQAYTCAEDLLGLINNILEMAKIEAQKIVLRREPVDLAELFDEVEQLVRGHLPAKPGLRLRFRPPSPPHQVIPADWDRLKRVLVNVVGNSLKFTEKGEVAVEAAARPDVGFMTIRVSDTGVGIAQERRAQLFQKFVQGDGTASRKYSGTGLGLAISKHLVEMMGGVIALESPGLGQGTTVSISLPLMGEQQASRNAEGSPEVAAPALRGPNETRLILVVDDNALTREMLCKFLNEEGYPTVEAATAEEAMETALRLQPALVLTDLALMASETAVVRNGIDLAVALGRKPELSGLPVILLTGAPIEARWLLRDLPGPTGLLVMEKPVDLERLRATFRMALDADATVAVVMG